VERACAGGSDAIPTLRTALSELGKAVAIDPSDSRALAILHRLLTMTPRTVPEEVEAQVQKKLAARERLNLSSLLVTGGAFFYLVPMLLLMGIHNWKMMGALVILGITSLTLRFHVSRGNAASLGRYGSQLCSLALYFFIGRVLGPLVLMTVPLIMHAALHSLSPRPGQRRFAWLMSSGLVIGMVALEHLGILSPSYTFAGGAMVIAPNLAGLPAGPTELMLLGMSVLTIALFSLSIGRLQQPLVAAERKQALYEWQLSALLPDQARERAAPSAGSSQS
jgi:hypothetical protein